MPDIVKYCASIPALYEDTYNIIGISFVNQDWRTTCTVCLGRGTSPPSPPHLSSQTFLNHSRFRRFTLRKRYACLVYVKYILCGSEAPLLNSVCHYLLKGRELTGSNTSMLLSEHLFIYYCSGKIHVIHQEEDIVSVGNLYTLARPSSPVSSGPRHCLSESFQVK